MKQQLLWTVLLLAFVFWLTGCRSSGQAAYVPVQARAFIKQWEAKLPMRSGTITSLHLCGDSLIVYASDNTGYWLGASGGQLQAINRIAERGHTLHPPVQLGSHVAIPTTVSIETYDKAGKHMDSLASPVAIQSSGAGTENSLFLGVSHPESGRLARFDLDPRKHSLRIEWELYTRGGIVATPAVLNDAVYAADMTGQVWAVDADRDALWSELPEKSFQTDGPITAAVVADDYGVYVASQDKKLYCLDRFTGRIKWSYHAGLPLIDPPVVLGNMVYQLLPNQGLAAISKTEGKFAREPVWVQPAVRQVLSSDEKHLYVRVGRSQIVALDKSSGQMLFQADPQDLTVFATNLRNSTIYAANKKGTVLAIRPVLLPGTVGQLVASQKQANSPRPSLLVR